MLWHSARTEEVLTELGTDRRRGLTEGEARQRLDTYGPNQLRGKPSRPLALRFLDQLRDPLTLVLLGVSTGVGLLFTHFGFSESNIITVFILGVLIISVVTVSPVFSVLSSLAGVLLFVGHLLYHEALTWNKILGIVICLVGLVFINLKV